MWTAVAEDLLITFNYIKKIIKKLFKRKLHLAQVLSVSVLDFNFFKARIFPFSNAILSL